MNSKKSKISLLKDDWKNAPGAGRFAALDIGSKTIGVAICDSAQQLASPLETIKRTKFSKDMQVLAHLLKDYDICGYILGYPVNMDGTTGPQCDRVMSFADEMRSFPQFSGIEQGIIPWITLWDERLSTEFVNESVDKYVDKRKTKINAKDSGLIDKLAAQLILQGALDFLSAHRV